MAWLLEARNGAILPCMGPGQHTIIFLVADWPGSGYGIILFQKSWEIRITSRTFEHTRPRNEPGKAVLGLPGTQDDGRGSRNSLEWVVRLTASKKSKKDIFFVRKHSIHNSLTLW